MNGKSWQPTVRGLILAAVAALLVITAPPELTDRTAWAQDWDVQADDERQQRVIERYREMLEQNPVEGMALDRLLGHVGRGAGLDRLVEHYEGRVERAPESVNLRLVLGHLFKARGDYEEAFAQYDRAVELDADNSLTWLSRGTIHLLTGERNAAVDDFEEALERESDRQRRRELLQELGELSFGQRDFDRGKEYFERLVGEAPRDEFIRMEYVRLLVQYRQFDEALEQYDVLLRLLSGDPRRRANTLRDKADVYELMDDWDAALEAYEEVLGLVRPDSWLAREVRRAIVDVFRQSGRLAEFVDEYGSRWRRGDSMQQMAVADVYAEMGRLEDALELYRSIARRSRSSVEPREKIIRILERLGKDDELPRAYRDLMRAAPDNHRYGLELASYYMRIGDRDEAADVLEQLRRRFWNQSYVVLDLAEYFARWNFDDEAERAYERVLAREGDDSAVLIDVGDYYFDRGYRTRALEVWRRLPESQLGEVEGTRRMAELLVERGVLGEGIATFEQLIEEYPDDERILRSMARALERARRWGDALERWQQLLRLTDRSLQRREARTRIVQLHDRQQQLRAQMMRWGEEFRRAEGEQATEAGFFLAEAHIRLREIDDAEKVLLELGERQDLAHEKRTTVLLLLEQAYVRSERYEEAITILEELSDHEPQMRDELLQRMSDHAVEARADEAAVHYAQRILEANPDDARGQARLGDVYYQVGELEAAARHYETAAEIDPRAFDVRLKLGRVLQALDRFSEAEQILMEVVENATQDHLVRDAGQMMLSHARRHDRLDALEARWAPLAFRMPVRSVHAELMFDLYDLLAGPLMLRAYHGSDTDRRAAQTRLYELGGRSASLLVDQLRSQGMRERVRALRMVGEMEIDLAAPEVARILDEDDERFRRMGIAVAARLGEDRFVQPLIDGLDDGSSTTRHLSVWALGHIDSPAARQALVELARERPDGIESQLALLGLRSIRGADEADLVVGRLERLVDEPGGVDRREAALLLALIGKTPPGDEVDRLRPLVVALARERQDRIGTWAAEVLGGLGDLDAARTLWQLALSEDTMAARRGEIGLVRLLGDISFRERTWNDDIRFFDWAEGDFAARQFLRSATDEAMRFGRLDYQGGQWTEIAGQGLLDALGQEQTNNLSDTTWSRLTGRQVSSLWSGGQVRRFAEIVLDNLEATEMAESQRVAMKVLRDGASGLGTTEKLPTDSLVHVLQALSVIDESDWNDRAYQLVARALTQGESSVRRQALDSLAATSSSRGLPPELVSEVVAALDDDDASVQIAAVRAVGELRLAGARSALVELEPRARPNLRRAVRHSLRKLAAEP